MGTGRAAMQRRARKDPVLADLLSPEEQPGPARSPSPAMDAAARMPQLALPFAVVGAAAGWLSVDFLDNPLLGFTPSHAEGLAAVCTAAIAGAVGRWLTRRCAVQEEWVESRIQTWIQVGGAVLGGGAVSGIVIGGLGFQNLEGAASGLVAGIGAGTVFLPVCVLVVAAARAGGAGQAGVPGGGRGPEGDVGADGDGARRHHLRLPAGLAGVAGPDRAGDDRRDGLRDRGGAARLGSRRPPPGAPRRRDHRGHGGAGGEAGEAGEPGDPEPDIDFGLGDELRARVVRGAAYRGRERTEARALGSADLAVQAVDRAVLKKALAFAVAGAVVAVHCLAAGVPSSLLAHEMICDLGVSTECRAAAVLMDEEGSAHLRARAWTLASRACNLPSHPDAEACRLLARMRERDGIEAMGPTTADQYHQRACLLGDKASCHVLELSPRR